MSSLYLVTRRIQWRRIVWLLSPLLLLVMHSSVTPNVTQAASALNGPIPYAYEGVSPNVSAAADEPFTMVWSSSGSLETYSVAWGDVDNDGDLDLAVGTDPLNLLYRNNNGSLTTSAVWSSPGWSSNFNFGSPSATTSLAWGDVDNDGDLDLAVGIIDTGRYIGFHVPGRPNQLYRNDAGTLTASPVWTSSESDMTYSVAWGDVDRDGDLDLVVGNGGRNRLYHNNNGTLTSSAVWSSSESDNTKSVAWGDVDSDGDLDLAVGNEGQPNRLYRNDRGTLTTTAVWSSSESDTTMSVAWGDVDGDGDLDLVVGNDGQPNRLYRNNNGTLTSSAVWSSTESDQTRSVMWGDIDGDGDLDLAVGNATTYASGCSCWIGQPNRLYRNNAGMLTPSAVWSSSGSSNTTSVAWGDVDNDGDLDLAMGNNSQPNRLYRNNTGTLTPSAVWSSSGSTNTTSVAWGDVDGDSDLDLVAGNKGQPNQVYRNNAGTLTPSAVWSSSENDATTNVAWGDIDNDGDLDLAVGNDGQPNRLYRNNAGMLTPSAVWSSSESNKTTSVAWGDVDSDGDLDLVAGIKGISPENQLYRNDGSTLTTTVWSLRGISGLVDNTSLAWGDMDNDSDLDLAMGNKVIFNFNFGLNNWLYRNDTGILTPGSVWSSSESDATMSVAWGDVDGDGDLDLAVGNEWQPNRLYRNDRGVLTPSAVWSSSESDATTSVAWGDVDGDSDLDLAVGNEGQPNRLYRNDGGILTTTAIWSSSESDATMSVAWGDVDSDGDLDLVAGNNGQPNRIYRNTRAASQLPGTPATVHLSRPVVEADAYSSPLVMANRLLPITYILAHPRSKPVQFIRASYSLNGGGQWIPAVAASGTFTSNLSTSPSGTTYIYNWDIPASGFFGKSDNVVFRLQAIPAMTTNGLPGPYLYGSYASTTFPFPVRGTQVRVMKGAMPATNALVYRLPAGQLQDAEPFANAAGQSFSTDGQGYLQGRGQFNPGDRLFALAPITTTPNYTLYYTSGAPNLTGLNPYIVTTSGVQTLTVSANNPLLLFNLNVSLEWDARQDATFLERLKFDLGRVSEFLYDWTNGQVALGNITIYHNREHWNDAHVRIYGSNGLHPNADQGGITLTTITETVTSNLGVADTLFYRPGQVRMAAVWDRFGSGETTGEDWSHALAHELSHYLLFLDDAYLGVDAAGKFYPLNKCIGTAMTDPYRQDYSEFKLATQWSPNCDETLAARTSGRSEWATIRRFYPTLFMKTNAGPSLLPLAVTQFRFVEPISPMTTLAKPIFYLTYANARYVPGGTAKAILYQPTLGRLIDLGHPVEDRVMAYGAHPNDRLCVYDPDARKMGCKTITPDNPSLGLWDISATWQPDIRVTPVTTRTLDVLVKNVPAGLTMRAQLYPDNDVASSVVTLLQRSPGVYSATVTLKSPTLAAQVQVWVNETTPRREAISAYALGGNPASPPKKAPKRAPVTSNDGDVTIYTTQKFPDREFYALQRATYMPTIPAWTTQIGPGYRLLKSSGAPNLTQASISFNYTASMVPSGEETFLQVYYYQEGTGQWVPLATQLDIEGDAAIAPMQNTGLYALLSSIQIPLYGPGWNNFAYPVNATREISTALQSIAGNYSLVYNYVPTETQYSRWKIFAPTAAQYVNTLNTLEFGKGYWINITDTTTLRLKGTAPAFDTAAGFSLPPATYYGPVQAGGDFTPTPGMTVTAWINGVLCGQGQTLLDHGQVVYALQVMASSTEALSACGAEGQVVQFKAGSYTFQPTAAWDNNQAWELPLSAALSSLSVYLPLIMQ
jgi:predicted nucleotidyltransferase